MNVKLLPGTPMKIKLEGTVTGVELLPNGKVEIKFDLMGFRSTVTVEAEKAAKLLGAEWEGQ